MKCCHCGKPMQQAKHQGVVLDQCTGEGGCGGVWLDAGEMQIVQNRSLTQSKSSNRVLAEIRTNASHRKDGSTLSCPKCESTMIVYQFAGESGVTVDRCSKGHGLWLESSELEAIEKFVEKNRRAASFAETGKPEAGSTKRCPRDGAELLSLVYEGQHLDQCRACFGVWCEDEELKTVVNTIEVAFSNADHPNVSPSESKSKVIPEIDLVADLCCVNCHQPMRRINYAYNSGIVIDRCLFEHGVWLDKDELEKLQVFIERGNSTENEVRKKFTPLLERAASEASASLDAALRKKSKKELVAEKATSPLFDVLSNKVDYKS